MALGAWSSLKWSQCGVHGLNESAGLLRAGAAFILGLGCSALLSYTAFMPPLMLDWQGKSSSRADIHLCVNKSDDSATRCSRTLNSLLTGKAS